MHQAMHGVCKNMHGKILSYKPGKKLKQLNYLTVVHNRWCEHHIALHEAQDSIHRSAGLYREYHATLTHNPEPSEDVCTNWQHYFESQMSLNYLRSRLALCAAQQAALLDVQPNSARHHDVWT